MFEIRNVSKEYNGQFALNNISMNIDKGLNFIVGSSGSGKTTLLKIISGIEQEFQGEVLYCGRKIKELTQKEKGYLYNNEFGFIWQDFNLLEDSTVLENVLLPEYLKANQNKKNAIKILKQLKIFNIAMKKVRYLSGGQKQRVAIARELMKNLKVIIADEPTSALDEKTSKITMDILRILSRSRTVIVVTHDTSLITEKDNVFELDKGELILKPMSNVTRAKEIEIQNSQMLSFKSAFSIAKSNLKNRFGRYLTATASILIAGVLLLTTVSGTITSKGSEELDKLFDIYGENILDLSIAGSFIGAGGTDGSENNKPNVDVTQDISGLYDKYVKDERVEFTVFTQAFNNIKITLNGKEYKVEQSGSVPVIRKMLSGKTPMGKENEVVVPESFVKKIGKNNDDIIGSEIEFSCEVINWDSGEPISKKAKTKATVVGVADTTVSYEYEGKKMEYTVDDSFLFSKSALSDLRKQADIKEDKINFLIRAKTPEDLISLKNELNKQGIVPLGRFELVEDFVNLNRQTAEQSGATNIIIFILSLIMIISIFFITGIMRRREYAIYKISGYTNSHMCVLNAAEIMLNITSSIVILLVTSPLINIATSSMFSGNILNTKTLFIGIFLILIVGVLAYITTVIVSIKTNAEVALKVGDR